MVNTTSSSPAGQSGGGLTVHTPDVLRNVPPELRETSQWIVWRWVERKKSKGKVERTKVPVNPATGAAGDVTDRGIWHSFDHAWDALECLDVAGIGFVVSEDDPYVGVDLDKCIEGGVITPEAAAIVARLDSYTEITPSGKGLRVWVRGKLPPSGRRKDHIELYDADRYFTVSGDHWPGTPLAIADRTEELAKLHAELFPPKPVKAPRKPVAPSGVVLDASDAAILERARRAKGGAAFDALMRGETSAHGDDHSRADLALCAALAFWFGGDVHAIDRVFRTSGLYRDKWDRADYREMTIAKALERSHFYDPARIHNGTPSPSVNGGHCRNTAVTTAVAAPEAFRLTDLGNAERLVHRAGRDLRFCHAWGKWLHWDERRWAIDQAGHVRKLAKETVRSIYEEAARTEDDADRAAIGKWAKQSEDCKRVNALLKCAESEDGIPVLPSKLDQNPWVLNCLNGTVDLKSGVLGRHSRCDLITQLCPVEFDPAARCPNWESTLELIFSGNHDLIGFFRMLCGVALTGDVSEQYLPILFGKGSNGKSTIVNTLLGMLGDYAMKAPPDLLMVKRHEAHPTERAGLFGKRLVVAIETGEGGRLNETMVKELTGSDPITARRMREDFWTFNPTHKIWVCTNHRPAVRGVDHAIWRRLRLVPFTVTIPDDRAVKDMPDRLIEEYPGILSWCVRGCLEWRKLGRLSAPEEVTSATEQYRVEEDAIGGFLTEHCGIGPHFQVKASVLYARYRSVMEGSGEVALSDRRFCSAMRDRGFERYTNNGTWYRGIGLRPDNNDTYVPM